MRLIPGTKLGAYEIREAIGAGGMGELYRARDGRLGRDVAIKVLQQELASDPERLRRFGQEARAASALNHPNIITVYDVGEHDGVLFIAMEYVQGKTLREILGEGPLALRKLLELATQIAEGLSKAHAAHIVHRDLKPENVMVTEDGLVKVLDFGLAKLRARSSNVDSQMITVERLDTHEDVIVGTAAYMSPEQAERRELDGRSDIFSFGSVLYEMITGQKAFRGESTLSTLSKILNEDPKAPSQLAPATPPELEKIVLRCLRKDPARRYQTMADLKVALEDVAEEWGPQRRKTPSRRRWAWVALPLLLLIAGVFMWLALREPLSVEPLRAVALTTFPGSELRPTLSPEGDQVAFMWTGPKQDNPDIYVQRIGSAGSPLRLTTDPGDDYNPAWSPDGRWIAFLRLEQTPAAARGLWLIPPLGGAERKVGEVRVRIFGTYETPGFLAWCPDSTCLVVTDSQGEGTPDALFVVSLETGEKRQLTNPPTPFLGDTQPAVSPDGRWLAFRRVPGPGAGELHLLPLGRDLTARGEPKRATLGELDAGYPAWMPDGMEILFSTGSRTGMGLFRVGLSSDKTPERLPFAEEDGQMPVVTRALGSETPRLVYVRSSMDRNIWRVETSAPGVPASSPPMVAISSTRNDFVGDISPDRRRVAFGSNRSGQPEIWLADPDGSNAAQLTSLGAVTAAPRWSPDGGLIAFQSNLDGQFEIYVIPVSSGKLRRITIHSGSDHLPSFSKDGQSIYFGSNRTGGWQIWKVPVRGGDAVQVTQEGGLAALESSDGTQLYYRVPGSPSRLSRVPVSGGTEVKLVEGEIFPGFAVVEKGIYFVEWLSGEACLRFFDFAAERSTTVARNLGADSSPLTATPDGRTILYTRLDSSGDDLMLVENFR
jgi:serine/threonine protein kinase